MNTATVEEVIVDQAIWRAWVLRGRERGRATDRMMTAVAVSVFVLAALGCALFLGMVK